MTPERAIEILKIDMSVPVVENELGETFPNSVLVTRWALELALKRLAEKDAELGRLRRALRDIAAIKREIGKIDPATEIAKEALTKEPKA